MVSILERILRIIISIRWTGRSVSGLVVIVGLICIILSKLFQDTGLLIIGVLFVVLGLFGAIIMTDMMTSRRRRW